jgi:hypothetical protein
LSTYCERTIQFSRIEERCRSVVSTRRFRLGRRSLGENLLSVNLFLRGRFAFASVSSFRREGPFTFRRFRRQLLFFFSCETRSLSLPFSRFEESRRLPFGFLGVNFFFSFFDPLSRRFQKGI